MGTKFASIVRRTTTVAGTRSGGRKESNVTHSRNIYCTCCHKTQRFLDYETHYGCPVCSKRLDKVVRVAKDERMAVKVTRVA